MPYRHLGLRLAIFGVVVVGTLVLGFSSPVFIRPACGCGQINGALADDLKTLDARIGEYARTHGGLYPTYAEVVVLHRGLYAPHEDTAFPMTQDIDIVTGHLKFIPARETAPMIAYSASPDQRAYVLRGVGVSIRYRHYYLFGRDLGEHYDGLEYPIFDPDDSIPTD